ncbi:DUF4328 domain-containing protein [Luteolibacter flavescens]|uniref:DUF4328 domain-containing protein n=1 Tax=Luteolibacter flavescens TaxID=1859460 RepID=A0ABT3FQ04_9BACT|nr:DUF4328 domain-containing protein [Luteolibacter flavescens]MCW1885274.1 DUF4328 domain-containing protein [Luteolibacter flavescens]
MDSEEVNPYATPAIIAESPIGSAPEVMGKYGPYRDNRRLAAWLIGLLFLSIAHHLWIGARDLAHLLGNNGEEAMRPTSADSYLSYTGISAVIPCLVLFGTWIVRSGKNAWLFAEVSRMRTRAGFQVKQSVLHYTPRWSVGWYFVPIACLWKPFVAMRDIVRASTLREGPPDFLLRSWWTLWILCVIIGSADDANIGRKSETEALIWATARAFVIALFLVAILLVRAVTALQTSTAAALAKADVSEPSRQARLAGQPGQR